MAIGIDPVPNHLELGLKDDDLLEMYRLMVLARRLDDRMWALNRQGRAPFVVSSSGHEATQVGTAFALDPSRDWALPYYRDVAFALALGMTPEEVFLGVFSKEADPASGGRQMPNHWSSPALKILTQSSVIATQFPHACGIAMELKRTGADGVVHVSGGEGSTSEGDWHEAMNFAAIHDLPVVFVIENNQYAISVPANKQAAVKDLSVRAQGYGFPGVTVDGNDVLAVYTAAKVAVARARDGEGPTFIEAKTYRLVPHTSDDDDRRYRSREEVEEWEKKGPLVRFRSWLEENGIASAAEIDEIEAKAMTEIDEATEYAEAAPTPDPATATRHVFVEEE